MTVLIRVFNNQDTIGRALDSVLSQTIDKDRYSILLVDNMSTDRSREIIHSYPELRIIESKTPGSLPTLNMGLRHVETEYVIILDADDWLETHALSRLVKEMELHPDTDYVYSDYYEVRGSERSVVSVKDNLFSTIAAGIIFSIRFLNENGYYDEGLIFPEYDLLIKTLAVAKRRYLAEPLYNYFRREGSITSDRSLVEKGKRELLEKYGKEYPIRDY